MRKSPDAVLRQITQASMLRLSDVPALVMDQSHILTMKSTGAEIVSSRPAVGADCSTFCDPDAFSKIDSDLSLVMREKLISEDLQIPIFFFGGTLSDRHYYAAVHEEGAMLTEEEALDPVLYREASEAIVTSARKLLETPCGHGGEDLLKSASRRLIRLKNFAKLTAVELAVKLGQNEGKLTLAHSVLELYLAKVSRVLPTFGYAVTLEVQTKRPLICRANPRTFLSIVTLFLFALLALSPDKTCRIITSLEEAPDIRKNRTIRLSFACRGAGLRENDPLESLAEKSAAFALELRACRRLLDSLSWQLSAREENGESFLSLAIPKVVVPKLIFDSPTKSVEPKIIDRLLEVYAPELELPA